VDVFFGPSPVSRSRLGLIVPKHGRNIVERNLVKRRLREIGRREVIPALDAEGMRVDVMIRARGKAYQASYEELSSEIRGAVDALCSDAS
jgi:ribonuclease P protein component